MALPETFVLILFSWSITVITLILADDSAFSRNWPNVKIKLLGVIFASFAFILSFTSRIYEIFTNTNTVLPFNQTIDLAVPSTSQLGSLEITIFIISFLIVLLSIGDLIITLMEDDPATSIEHEHAGE